jgi:cell division protein FtsL
MLVVFTAIFGLAGTVMIVFAWGPLRGFELSHRLQTMSKAEENLSFQNRCLAMEIEKLQQQERIERIAREKLRLEKPSANQMVVIEWKSDDTKSEGLSISLARFSGSFRQKFAKLFGPPSALVGIR